MAELDGGWQPCFERQVSLLVFVTTEPAVKPGNNTRYVAL